MDDKRHQISWHPGNHWGNHNDCDCDLDVTFPCFNGLIPDMRVRRYQGCRRTIEEMYSEVKALICSNYILTDRGVEQRSTFDDAAYEQYKREYYTPKSQIAVDAPFPVKNTVTSEPEGYIQTQWKGLHEMAERRYWQVIFPPMNQIDKEEKREGISTLQAMCAKRLSWCDAVYGKWEGEKRVIHTKEFFPLEKAIALYSDFCVDTTPRKPEELTLWKYLPKALNGLLTAMGVYENHGKLQMKYDKNVLQQLVKRVKLFTSGGIMPGHTQVVEHEGQKIRVQSAGQKVVLMEAAARKFHKTMCDIASLDEVIIKAIFAIIKAKDEFKFGQFKTQKELERMKMKIREFFIPDLSHIFMCILVNEDRMLLERNNIIRIGMTYWYGGAYLLCKYLNVDIPGFYYVDGDIEGLDKHISDWLLLLYCSGVYPYYNWKSMSEKEAEFVLKLLEYWATNVCCKLVCHIGGFWRYMMGVMYSGGKETSHGDSWIMAFIFYCYCEHMKALHPHIAHLIDVFMIRGFIAIVVYGDDHIWCAPLVLISFMNQVTWKAFLKDYFHMNLRDENLYHSLYSVPDGTGRLKVRGPKFLKRYFVKNENPKYAPILPYKDMDEQICKAFVWKFDTVAENVAVTIGFAWDTQATNIPAYSIIKTLYDELMTLSPKTPAEMLQELNLDDRKNASIRRLMRKVGLKESEFFKFPTLDQMMERHILDRKKANFHRTYEDLAGSKDPYEFEFEDEEEMNELDW